MKGIFWNCNALGDPKKYEFISDLVGEKSLDFVALSESGTKDSHKNFSRTFVGGRTFWGIVKLLMVDLVAC